MVKASYRRVRSSIQGTTGTGSPESTVRSDAQLGTEAWRVFVPSFMDHLRSVYSVPGLGSVTGLGQDYTSESGQDSTLKILAPETLALVVPGQP